MNIKYFFLFTVLPEPKEPHKRDKITPSTSHFELESSKHPSEEIEEISATQTTPLPSINLISNELSSKNSPVISFSNTLETGSSTNNIGSGSGEIPKATITATRATNVRIFY